MTSKSVNTSASEPGVKTRGAGAGAGPVAAENSGEPGLETRRLQAALEQRLFGIESAPVTVGRFVVVDRIGQGGWGTVYRAYDPDLDRRVAVKVLNVRAGATQEGGLAQEAKILAKLNHPNVVTVHEVGVTEAGMFFMAMEFVEGGTLREVAAKHTGDHSRNRSLAELFLQAARGLEAAHASGLVHRDLKPANLLVGSDDRLRIADFGLAQLGLPTEHSLSTTNDAGLGETQMQPPSGESVGWLGTPAYMAPEQFEGVSDERGDQFNLCASFYEMFFGLRPFAGRTIVEVQDSALAGKFAPAHDRSVPGWIRAILVRGLAANPAERYPSVSELRTALERGEGARRRWVLGLAGAGMLAAAGVWGVARGEAGATTGPDCAEIASAAAPSWNDSDKDRVRRAFAASGYANDERVFTGVERTLDHWGSEWETDRERACVAAQTASGPGMSESPAPAEQCLDTLAQSFLALVKTLETSDPNVVAKAGLAALSLTSPDSCSDGGAELERALIEVPTQYVATLYGAKSLQRLGKFVEAEQVMTELRPHVDPYPAVAAMSDCLLGGLAYSRGALDPMRTRVEACMQAAEHGSLSETLVQAWLLRFALHHRLQERDAALFAARRAESISRRAEVSTAARARVRWRLGLALRPLLRYDEALAEYEKAFALYSELGTNDLQLASLSCDWSEALFFSGKRERAVEKAEACRDLRIAGGGADSPHQAQAWCMLAQYHHWGDDDEQSLEAADAALAILAIHPWYSPRIRSIALIRRAVALNALGRFDEAQEAFEAAGRLVFELYGSDGPDAMSHHNDVAVFYRDRGNADRAFEEFEKAGRIADRGGADKSPENAGIAYMNLARELAARGREDEARAYLDKSMARLESLRPDDAATAVGYRVRIAQVNRELGQYEDARASVDRALRIVAEHDRGAHDKGRVWEEDARLRLAQGDREGAGKSYGRAVEEFSARGDASKRALAKLQEWGAHAGLDRR